MMVHSDRSISRIGAFEFAAGFIAAAAIGIAGGFAADRTVPKWLLIFIFAGGVILAVGAVLWLLVVARRGQGTSLPGAPRAVDALAPRLGAAFMAVLLAASATAFGLGIREDPDRSSPYDGRDPVLERCNLSGAKIFDEEGPPLIDPELGRVGYVGMFRSRTCNTVWAFFHLDEQYRKSLFEKHRTVAMDLHRPADGHTVMSTLELRDDQVEGFSDMISVRKACASVQVYFEVSGKRGPTAKIDCTPKPAGQK
jgi:hypothetical protein